MFKKKKKRVKRAEGLLNDFTWIHSEIGPNLSSSLRAWRVREVREGGREGKFFFPSTDIEAWNQVFPIIPDGGLE
jgi:hypothetical protein